MYSGKEPKNLLDTDGGFEQIRLSAKTFEKVHLSHLVGLCMTSSRMQMDSAKTKGYFAFLPCLFHLIVDISAAASWPIHEDLTDLLSQMTVPWNAVLLKPVLVLRGHPASAHFSHTTVELPHLENVLASAIVNGGAKLVSVAVCLDIA